VTPIPPSAAIIWVLAVLAVLFALALTAGSYFG